MEKNRRQILANLLEGPLSFWKLITLQDRHLSLFMGLLKEMLKEGIIDWQGDKVSLTPKGFELAKEAKLAKPQNVTCPLCRKKTVVKNGLFEKVYAKMEKLLPRRPPAVAEYDQGPVDLETVIARVMFMYEKGDLQGQKIFILGDDDLTGIAAALTGMPELVTVVEVDGRLVEFIRDFASQEKLTNLQVLNYDVRSQLPANLKEKHDTFFVDPVETLDGILLFLTRSAQALKGEGSAGYFGLTHLEASRRKWHLIQKNLLEMNFVITDILTNFQWYNLNGQNFVGENYPLVTEAPVKLPPPEISWYSSNLFRIEAVDKLKTQEFVKIPAGRDLYFDEEAYATIP